MSARRTMEIWAVYVSVLGLGLVTVPNLVLAVFAIPPTDEVWIRVLGMVLLFFGYYYAMSIREDERAIWRWSVPVRLMVPVFFLGFVLTGLGPPVLMLIAGADLIFALLTWRALRAEAADRG